MKRWIFLAVLLYFIPITIYWLVLSHLNDGILSNNSHDWASFGSFIGGVLSPLFTLIGFIFIYKSIQHSDDNHNKQISQIEKQHRQDFIIKLIQIFNDKLNEPIYQFAKFGSSEKICVYEDNSIPIDFPTGQLKETLIQFQTLKSTEKRFSKNYIELLSTISANANLCLITIMDNIIKLSDKDEYEESLNLLEAMADFHGTMAILEHELHTMYYSESSSLLDPG